MAASFSPRITIVTRDTRMKGLLKRWSTKGMLQFNLKRARVAAAVQSGDLSLAESIQATDADEAFDDLEAEDQTYQSSVSLLTKDLNFGMPVHVIDRLMVPTYDFGLCQAVVVVGRTGWWPTPRNMWAMSPSSE